MDDINVQFENEFKKPFTSDLMRRVGQMFIDKTESDSREGKDPTGTSYEGYSPATRKPDPVTLRDKNLSIENPYLDAAEDYAEVRYSDYLDFHQRGTAQGGKTRKVVPEPEDVNSAGVQEAIDRVSQIIVDSYE